ncbi:MAG: cytochrome P450 [Halobacteriovoraceae bacterium]|nr:cytochrome P450 [Halobacteriovoraceae bacterium]
MANENKRSSFEKMWTFVNLNHIKGPRGLSYLKWVKRFQKDTLKAFTQVNEEFGDIASFPWPMNSVIIYDPKLIKIVLSEKNRDYIKGEQIEELRAVVGDGLATNNDHETWLKSRKLLAKEFNNKSVSQYLQDFESLTKESMYSWSSGSTIDICQEMKHLTFHIACKTILGGTLTSKEAHLVDEAVTFTSIVTYNRIFEAFPIPYWMPTAKNFEFKKHFKKLDNVVFSLIEETRIKPPSENQSVLEKLVFAKDDETDFSYSDTQLRDEILTLMLAGHETTAHSLTWTLGLLAKFPQIQSDLFQELESVAFSRESLEELPLLNAFLQESMRLYPAFPTLSRKTKVDTELGKYFLPKNTNVVIPIFVTQRNSEYWENARTFNHERFLKGENLRNFKHLPFGKGPRRCIAELFAMQEMRVILNQVLKQFKFELPSGELPKETAFVSLKPIGGMPLRVLKRSDGE